MTISVAMCTYNGDEYLAAQLDSLATQSQLPDELIVCDDASHDNTGRLLADFARRAPFPVRIHVNDHNVGTTRNFERAIGLCNGDIIALADQDDVWRPDKLRRLDEIFAAQADVGLVFSDLEMVDANLQPLGHRAWQCDWVEFDASGQHAVATGRAVDLLATRNVVTGCAMAFRSKYRPLILPIPLRQEFIHDHWIALVTAAVGGVVAVPEPLVKYRTHPRQQAGLMALPRAHGSAWRVACRRLTRYPTQRVLYALLTERLAQAATDDYAPLLPSLRRRAAHAQVKEELRRQSFLRRVPAVLREIASGRYHLFPHPEVEPWREIAFELLPYRLRYRVCGGEPSG